MTSRRGTTVQDWLLLAVSLSFVAASAWLLLVGKGGTVPLAALAFFGACAAVAGWLIVGKRRAHRLRPSRPSRGSRGSCPFRRRESRASSMTKPGSPPASSARARKIEPAHLQKNAAAMALMAYILAERE